MSLCQSLNRKWENFTMFQQEENQRWAATEPARCPAKRQPAVSGSKHLPIIRIFIAYESDLNRDRAQVMLEELSRRLGQSFAFLVSWWSLKSLGDPEIRVAAGCSVGEADIICFSLLSGGELPQTVIKWIEKGVLERKTNKLCLLALVETGGTVAPLLSPAEVYLSQLSMAAGVDCLCYSDSIPIARSIRSRQQQRQRGNGARRGKRVPRNGTRSDQEFSTAPLSFWSRRRVARTVDRENLQPQ
jgi:hypothetical protein